MTVLESINEFYIRHRNHVVRFPNLIYLFIIGAIDQTKTGGIKIKNNILVTHCKEFPPKQVNKKSTSADFQFIYKY